MSDTFFTRPRLLEGINYYPGSTLISDQTNHVIQWIVIYSPFQQPEPVCLVTVFVTEIAFD